MSGLDELLDDIPALGGLAPAHRSLIAGCARDRVYAAGARIMREGDPAEEFFIIRAGAVAVQTTVPGRGAVTVQTLHDGELLGWSWLLPPYRHAWDARALQTTRVIALDGACLRGRCDADPALGYDLLRLLAAVYVGRLQETRLRLLDLYGAGHGGPLARG